DDLRAVHFAVDSARAAELRRSWEELGLSRVPLDVIECPDRRLVRAAVELVADLSDGDSEITVLLPRVEHVRSWHRLLHDRTSNSIARALADFPHTNVTFVPYHLGGRSPHPTLDPSSTARVPARSALPTLPKGVTLPEGTVPIADALHRERVTIVGRVRAVRVQPRAGVATLQCTVADGTGEITVVFLGRRHVGGWEPGAIVSVTGMVGERSGRLEILNPDYELFGEVHA
ncbi:MAG TPA: OB-fold nucleic acid binding domain-containing protein, partial [Nocardioides sp.]|nr:OB-fold nucleic acid binding domain-containing protein [Nocardioides sp.]